MRRRGRKGLGKSNINLRKKIVLKVVFVFALFLSNIALGSQSIIIYRDFGHKGDENQAHGVVHAYANLVKDIEVKEFNVGEEEKLQSYVKKALINKDKKPILLAVGEKTVSSFAALLPFEGAITIHLCHMVTFDHSKLLGKVDFIALPTHSIGNFGRRVTGTRTQLIKTLGVSHHRHIEEIEHTYHVDKARIPFKDSYLGVILAGDAPTPENKILLFTEENARELARYVAHILNNRHLLIINGPRTGKYDPRTLEEIKGVHRNGKKDFVTQAFLDELIRCHVSSHRLTLFDFQFSSSTSKDMDLVLGAIRATQSVILVPGESTSSISESIAVLPPGTVIVYYNTAMNQVHTAHVQSELEAGRIKLLLQGFNVMREKKEGFSNPDLASKRSAAETIASALLD